MRGRRCSIWRSADSLTGPGDSSAGGRNGSASRSLRGRQNPRYRAAVDPRSSSAVSRRRRLARSGDRAGRGREHRQRDRAQSQWRRSCSGSVQAIPVSSRARRAALLHRFGRSRCPGLRRLVDGNLGVDVLATSAPAGLPPHHAGVKRRLMIRRSPRRPRPDGLAGNEGAAITGDRTVHAAEGVVLCVVWDAAAALPAASKVRGHDVSQVGRCVGDKRPGMRRVAVEVSDVASGASASVIAARPVLPAAAAKGRESCRFCAGGGVNRSRR